MIHFLYPEILYALGLATLPIIIHLINLRRHKKIYFSSLQFLQNIQQQSKKSRRIYEWILLAARTILIAALVLAFAGPVIQKYKTRKNQSLHIILDNTMSMSGNNPKGPLYEQAKTKATEIINLLNKNSASNLHYLSNGISFKNLSTNKAVQKIMETPLSHGTTKLNTLIKRIKNDDKNPKIIVISDFQQNILSPDTIFQDTNLYINLIPLNNRSKNISIDSAWFESPLHIPNQPSTLKIRITNHSNSLAEELPVKINVNNKLLSAGTTSIEPNSNIIYQTTLELNQVGLLKIKAHLENIPIDFDNTHFSGIYVIPKTNILETSSEPSKYLCAFFDDSTSFRHQYSPVNTLTLSTIQKSDAIILHRTNEISAGIAASIIQHVKNGANLIVIPDLDKSLQQINQVLESLSLSTASKIIEDSLRIKDIDTKHAILTNALQSLPKNTQFPLLDKHLLIEQTNKLNPLIYNELNHLLLIQKRVGNGNIYLFTFNALDAQFALTPLFVPLFFNATTITNKNLIPEIICNQQNTINIRTTQINIEKSPIKISGIGTSFIPYSYHHNNNLNIHIRKEQIKLPGFYKIQQNDSTINILAVNHQSDESKMNFISIDKLKNKYFKIAQTSIFDSSNSANEILDPIKKLWRYFISIVLLMLLIEMIIIFLKEKKL